LLCGFNAITRTRWRDGFGRDDRQFNRESSTIRYCLIFAPSPMTSVVAWLTGFVTSYSTVKAGIAREE
jgi:hypothetical protein